MAKSKTSNPIQWIKNSQKNNKQIARTDTCEFKCIIKFQCQEVLFLNNLKSSKKIWWRY